MTDNELQRVVTAELNWDPAVPSTAIGVASYERDAVERIAWQAAGVSEVVNELVVA